MPAVQTNMKGIEQVLVNLKEQVEKIDQEIGAIAAKYRIQRSQQKVAVVIPCYYFPHNYCDCNHLFFFFWNNCDYTSFTRVNRASGKQSRQKNQRAALRGCLYRYLNTFAHHTT